ncbi:hypothetical protein EUZ85_20370 [Hahella sp. KA22]|nr:hypothetical protein ENC22_17790 [Hahella sp. KA22]QAY56330.1 hypothetical protein EUZ85_20370 [Hahella sp. KA22]
MATLVPGPLCRQNPPHRKAWAVDFVAMGTVTVAAAAVPSQVHDRVMSVMGKVVNQIEVKRKHVFDSLFKSYCARLTQVVLALLLLVSSSGAYAAPGIALLEEQAYHTGGFNLREMDFWVQSKGSPVRLSRVYKDGRGWTWNERWDRLKLKKNEVKLVLDVANGGYGSNGTNSLKLDKVVETPLKPEEHYLRWDYIKRGDTKYEHVKGQKRFGYGGNYIEATPTGYIWHNREGEWITYDSAGVMLKYGDAEGNEIYFKRDEAGRVAEVKDTLDRTLYSLSYVDEKSGLVKSATDYTGRTVSYHYTNGHLTSVIDVRGYEWRYEYNDDGDLNRRIDPENNVTTYGYEDRRVDQIVYADGSSIAYEYGYDKKYKMYLFTTRGVDGTVIDQKILDNDPEQEQKVYFVSQGGSGSSPKPKSTSVLKVKALFDSVAKDPKKSYGREIYSEKINGKQFSTVHYSHETGIRTLTDVYGKRTALLEDQWGNTIKEVYPDGEEVSSTYDARFDYVTSHTNKAGIRSTYSYDSAGRMASANLAVGTDVASSVTFAHTDEMTKATYSGKVGEAFSRYSYFDDRGNNIKQVDSEGYETLYTYDVMGNVKTMTTPRGYTYTFEYDDAGNLLSVTDPLFRTTSYVYDKVGNVITETAPNKSKTSFTYNALNQWEEVKDQLDQKAEHKTDPKTNTTRIASAGKSVGYIRNGMFGEPLEFVDGEGNRVEYVYDNQLLKEVRYPTLTQKFSYNNQRLIEQVTTEYDGQSSVTSFEYDVLGQLTKKIVAGGRSVSYEYDELGRVSVLKDADGGLTQFFYDHRSNLIKVIDPENREARLEYDTNGFIKAEVFVVEGVEHRRTYSYDPNGNLAQVITPIGEKLVYTYDEADQLKRLEYFVNKDAALARKVVNFAYDELGLLKSYSDGETSAVYRRDELGHLAEATVNYGPFSKTIAYTYDENGVVDSYTNPESLTYEYGYNGVGKISTVTVPGAGVITFNSYNWGQPTSITFPGGASIERNYNGLMAFTENKLLDPASNVIMRAVYGYDGAGNITNLSTDHGDYTYGYDNLNRLESVDYPQSTPELTDQAYTYDAAGNRLSRKSGSNDAEVVTEELEYNDANQLVRQGEVYYHYDANGHLISKGADATGENPEYRYIYSADERLVRVESGAGTVIAEYGYDPFGRRLWKEVAGERTYFLYNFSGLMAEYDASGNLLKEYHYLPTSTWMSDPLFMREKGEIYYYQVDHLGTPTRLIKPNGETVWEGRYDAFGEAEVVSAKVENNLRLPGQYFDKETGFHHNFMRDYDPDIGRYIQADPLGIGGGLNRYAYSRLSPLMAFDPYGTDYYEITDKFFDLISPKDEDGYPIPLPQGFVDGAAAIGDNAISTVSGGLVSGQEIRNWLGIDGGVNMCSGMYRFVDFAAGFIPWGGPAKGISRLTRSRKTSNLSKGNKTSGTKNNTGPACQCFVAGTLVETAEGKVAIEEIEVGDQVYARDEITGETQLRTVLNTIQNQDKQIVTITVRDSEGRQEEINTTPEHPIWVEGESWSRADKLEEGDYLVAYSGKLLRVVSLVYQTDKQPTFNFDVEGNHNYFVGESGAWVHNTRVCDLTSRVRAVNGRRPINSKYAGKTVPLEDLPLALRKKYPHSVTFNGAGFPDFSRYSIKNVRITLGKSRGVDFGRADKAAGYTKNNPRPNDYTWHHHQDTGYMQLVPTDIHDAIKHTGGIAKSK